MFYKAKDNKWAVDATQGGIVRGCADWLLKNGHITKIVGVLYGATPGEFVWGATDDPNKLAKSVYKDVSPTEFLQGYSEEDRKTSLFIGLPCQVSKNFKYRITLLCSGSKRGEDKPVADYRYGFKPDNYAILYADGSVDSVYSVAVDKLHKGCARCNLDTACDMLVGDLHRTPYNLVRTSNPLFDEYIATTQHKEFTEQMFNLCKINK